MLEVDEASLAKENANRKDQIDSMVEESKREELVSQLIESMDVGSNEISICLYSSTRRETWMKLTKSTTKT